MALATAVMLGTRPARELVPGAQVPREMASDWRMPPALRAHEGPGRTEPGAAPALVSCDELMTLGET